MSTTYSFGEAGPVSAREGSNAQILVTRSGALGDGAVVVMATNGTASSVPPNHDYDLGSGMPGGSGYWFNFSGSETEKVLDIPLIDDCVRESTEDFSISLSPRPGSRDSVIGPGAVQVNILNRICPPTFPLPGGGKPPIGGGPFGGGGGKPGDGRPTGDGGDKPHDGGGPFGGGGGKPGDGRPTGDGKPPIGGGKPPIGGGKPPIGGGQPPIGGGGGGKPPVGPPPPSGGGKPPVVGGAGGNGGNGGDEPDSQATPSITGASFDGNSLEIEFDDIIAPGKINNRLFTVTINGKRARVLSATVADDDFVATLELSKEIPLDSDVIVSYKDLRGDQTSGVLQSVDGLDVASFTGLTASSFF